MYGPAADGIADTTSAIDKATNLERAGNKGQHDRAVADDAKSRATCMVMNETQIHPMDMTPGPPFDKPSEKDVVMPVHWDEREKGQPLRLGSVRRGADSRSR